MAVICGSHLKDPHDVKARQQLYKIYRYSNYIQWESINSFASPAVGARCLQDFVQLGVLTHQEVKMLRSVSNTEVPWLVISWLATALDEYFELESVHSDCTAKDFLPTILDARDPGRISASRLTPNVINRTMFLLGFFFLILIVVSFPFSLMVYSNAPSLLLLGTPCFQPVVLFGVSLYASCIRLTLMGLFLLKDPFAYPNERLLVDSVLSTTDRYLFTLLRTKFRSSSPAASNSVEETPRGTHIICET
mmetsp:Transcript_17929/g.26744  ORF Transcript_17929/g.26744 Transcript_17929/m.26744 type:complete len:249 (+) Transcript_17929:1583-2329(+)